MLYFFHTHPVELVNHGVNFAWPPDKKKLAPEHK